MKKDRRTALFTIVMVIVLLFSACAESTNIDASPIGSASPEIAETPAGTPANVPTQTPESVPTPFPIAAKTEILSVPFGDGEQEIGLNTNNEYPESAEDFLVTEDGRVFILDTQNGRIMCFDNEGKHTNNILLKEGCRPLFICMMNDKLYVLVEDFNCVVAVTVEGRVLYSYKLPKDLDPLFTFGMYCVDNKLFILEIKSSEYKTFMLNESTKEFEQIENIYEFSLDGKQATIRNGSNNISFELENANSSMRFIESDADGNIYIWHKRVIKDSIYEGLLYETTIKKYSKDGEMQGAGKLTDKHWSAYPTRCARVLPGGSIYVMACLDEAIKVYRVELG